MPESDDDAAGDTMKVTAGLPESWVGELDEMLDYGDSRSEWVREAIRERMVDEFDPDEVPETALAHD